MIPIAKPLIDENEKENVLEVMDSGMLACGQYVKDFEEEFASYIGTDFGNATTSGTTGLHVALKAAGIEEGDKVLTTPFTFIASSNAILYCGAEPVFVDVDPDTFNIDPQKMREALEANPEIKAAVIVHLYGLSCEMNHIMELVEEYDIKLIEDCAQSHGAKYEDDTVGTFGDTAVFSFYPTKNMTTGEGGIVLTGDKEIDKKCNMLIKHGSSERYQHEILGYNYRMTNIAAAIGLKQLEKLDQFNNKRQENAEFLTKNLKDLDWLETPYVPEEREHVFHQYTLKVDNRDEFVEYLEENGVGYGIHYDCPAYRQPLYKKMGYDDYSLPVTERLVEKVVSIPVHPALSDADLKKIVRVIRDYK